MIYMNTDKTYIYLVRHGESLGNLNRICLGHTDLDLTELGYEQAERTAQALRDVDFSAIYSSDLVRARNTAKPHCLLRGKEAVACESFRELYFGDWENCSVEYLTENYREDFTVGWRQIFGTFTPPGGESVVEMAERMVCGVKKAAQRHLGANILIVSHAAAIRAFWGKISGLTPDKWANNPFPSNASYSVVEYSEGKLVPLSYSNDAHLGDIATNIKH